MKLDQFKFEESHRLGTDEEATLKTNAISYVRLLRNKVKITVQKVANGNLVYNVAFLRTEKGERQLELCLKNISKKR